MRISEDAASLFWYISSASLVSLLGYNPSYDALPAILIPFTFSINITVELNPIQDAIAARD